MQAFIGLIINVLDFYTYILIASVIMSWLVAFNMINTHNNFVQGVLRALSALTEPVLGPIRRILPDLGGIDISPIVVFFLIIFIKDWLIGYFFR